MAAGDGRAFLQEVEGPAGLSEGPVTAAFRGPSAHGSDLLPGSLHYGTLIVAEHLLQSLSPYLQLNRPQISGQTDREIDR